MTLETKRTNRPEKLLRLGTAIVFTVWTVVVGGFLWWSIASVHQQTQQVVISVANAYFNKDLAFRLWGTSHGGVYVPITETVQPNPYLTHLPERDIETPSGRKLTLMNPAYMIREMMAQFTKLTGTSGHLTSLNLLNPINTPDDWEREVLASFDAGVKEAIVFTEYNGQPHLRLMRPFITKKPCLKCHAQQGYVEGDVRGGTSISIPLAPYLKLEQVTIRNIVIMHIILFLCGVFGILFASRKISEHIQRHLDMEEEARKQYVFTQSIINSLSHPLLVVNASDYQVVLANDAASKGPKSIGKTCHEMSHGHSEPCSEQGILCPLQKVVDSKKGVVVEHNHVDESGVAHDVEVQCFPIFNDQGTVHQVIEYSYDITERKRAEQEKLMLQTQLQHSQKLEAIGTIAGGIAHDFNNILSGVLGYAELAKMALPEKDKVWTYVDEIVKAGNRASALVKQILNFTRKTSQEIIPQPIAGVVKETLELLSVSLPKRIEVKLNVDENCEHALLDPTQTHQVIMNLATNAFHAMEEKGGLLEVTVTHVDIDDATDVIGKKPENGSYLLLLVRDTGCGMDGETLEKIFDPFFTTKEIGRGTGMGLSVVQGIVQVGKGAMSVESTVGEGTTVRIYFPDKPQDRFAAEIEEEDKGMS